MNITNLMVKLIPVYDAISSVARGSGGKDIAPIGLKKKRGKTRF